MIEARVCGIPCLIQVDCFNHVEPQGKWADSDWDCYGYTEIEFTVCDRRGRKADWLHRKMDDAEIKRIENIIIENRGQH